MLENVEKYTEALPEFSYRLRMKAGLTGLAQIYGKYNTSPKDKLVMDLMYIENYSIWQDFKLIFQTVTVFLKASESTEAFGVEELYDFDEDRERNRKAKKRGQPGRKRSEAVAIDQYLRRVYPGTAAEFCKKADHALLAGRSCSSSPPTRRS